MSASNSDAISSVLYQCLREGRIRASCSVTCLLEQPMMFGD